MTIRSILTMALCTSALACNGQPAPSQSDAAPATTTATSSETAKACADKEEQHADCTCSKAGVTNQLTNPAQTTKTDSDGNVIAHLGNEFTSTEELTVAALIADPTKYEGKSVRVRGNVAGMCKHKRAWFAVVGDDQSGNHVRVFTTPVFLVPHDAIGKTGVAEGVVELLDVSPSQGAHVATEHKLGEAAKAPKQVIIRATGAEFS